MQLTRRFQSIKRTTSRAISVGISRAYLDSYYLLEMVDKSKSRGDVQKLLYQIKQPTFQVFVSQTVLGEVVAKILQKPARERSDALSKLPQILQDHNIDAAACLTPPQGEALEIMRHLRAADTYLDVTDIMIVSHALADPRSKFFFTPDSTLTQNHRLHEYEKRLREDAKRETELKISDGL